LLVLAPRGSSAPPPEAHEATPRDGPRIYVASLTDYNAGVLHGQWIDAANDVETLQAQIDEMLRASPTMAHHGDVAEEWAIHDYDGFGELRLEEHEALSTIAIIANGIDTHGLAFAAWVAHSGARSPDVIDRFEDHYQGKWESVQAYAENLLDELGAQRTITDAPQWLQSYLTLDVAGFARDLEISGDIITAHADDGGVWVWTV
jgi:antirestriction protein